MNVKKIISNRLRTGQKIYIVPTQMGGYLIGLIFLMFLLAIGYSNNLLLIITLLIFALNLFWVIESHYFLSQIELDGQLIGDSFKNELFTVKIYFKNKNISSADISSIQVETDLDKYSLRIFESKGNEIVGDFVLNKRGKFNWKYIKIASARPFGLYKTWKYYPININNYSYPSLLDSSFSSPHKLSSFDGVYQTFEKGNEDIFNLVKEENEGAGKISWKHYAKTGDLLLKQGEKYQNKIIKIKFDKEEFKREKEDYLSRLATIVNDAFKMDVPTELIIHGKTLGPSKTKKHWHECLKELAQC